MWADVEGAESNDGAADSKEDQNDYECEENATELAAEAKLEGTPVDVLRCWHFFILYEKLLTVEEVFRFRLINAATATASHTAMRTIIEEIVIVEVSQAIYLWLLILEVNIGRNGLWMNLKSADVSLQFLLILLEACHCLLVSTSKNHLKLFLLDLLLELVEFLEIR